MKPQEILPAFTGKAHIKKLIAYAKPYAKLLWAGLFCMIVVACASAASAKLMKPIINDIFVDRNKDMLMPVTLGIFAIFFAKGLFTYGESVLMSKVGNRIIADIQKDLFHKVVYADLRFYFSIQSGDLVSRFMNDVAKLNTAVTGTISNIGKDFLTLLFFIAVMFDEDWHLALIVFFVLPIAILPVVKIGRYMRKAAKRIQEHTSDLTVYLTQAFQGIRLIKSYRLEAYETDRIYQAIEDVFARTLKGVRMKAASHPIMEFLGGVAIATVIVYGGKEVINGTQTPGAFFAFITALIMSYEPLKRLANLNANLQEQLAAADRIFGLMAYQNQIQDSARAKDLKISRGDINIDNVAFYYNPGQPVLREINFKIPAGQKIALVGPSGGGKSTLMNLLLRFFDPSSGQILIDDHPLKDYTLNSLRDQIAMVSQDVVLFDDTIEANIRFGNPNATLEQIQEAAKAAAAHDFIVEFPQGYQTQVGEQGTRLSGGQRQRISIARAMLKQAPILLLDEPTSALDSQSETIIQEALARLMKGKTTLVIAHRLATVRDADCIYLMEHGLISAFGTHEILMKKSTLYQDLCRKQFAE